MILARTAAIRTSIEVGKLFFRFHLLYGVTQPEFERIIDLSYHSPLSMVEFIENFEIQWRKSKLNIYEYFAALEKPNDA